jgi:hypothetical protein
VVDGNPRVAELLDSVSNRLEAAIAAFLPDIRESMERTASTLQGDASISSMLEAAASQGMSIVLHGLRFGLDLSAAEVPAIALEYGRRLAQRNVPAVTLVRAYRQGEVEFIRWCIQDLTENTAGNRDDVLAAAFTIFETVTGYVDRALDVILTAYAEDRDQWLQYNSVVFASRINELLEADSVDVPRLERELDYRLSRFHLGLVLSLDEPGDKNPLSVLEGAVKELARSNGFDGEHLLLPRDQTSALAWLASANESPPDVAAFDRILAAIQPGMALAVGRPAHGVTGFRRTHEQATSARKVAIAAGPARARVTPFESVAPIAMMCADLKSTRRWVSDTLGGLAVQSDRNAMLRETARAFLESDGSYMATADHLSIHRNTAQYRVRKAEEVRGRPLRDGRLDVELALLACHWLGESVLEPVN